MGKLSVGILFFSCVTYKVSAALNECRWFKY